MKVAFVGFLVAAALFAGCVEDPTDGADIQDETPGVTGSRWIDPSNETDGLGDYLLLPDEITKLTDAGTGAGPGGNGVWMWNDRAYLSTGRSAMGIVIFDIRDPFHPVELGNISEQYARDVDVLNYGNRTVIAVSAGGPMLFYDVTNPAEVLPLAKFDFASHNLGVHRPGHVVYNSRSLGAPLGGAEIIDARDPDAIRVHKVWEFERVAADGTPVANTGCHDVRVYPEINRAYCAAITQTLEWDVTDPLEPKILRTIDNPLINIHHSAHLILDHTVLVIGDEYGGAALYACYGNVETPVADLSTPTGAIWFYDLTTPVPTLLSWISPPVAEPPRTCTAHFGSEIGDGTGMVAYGWYSAGTLLVDATDPMAPRLVHQYDSGGSVWDARYYRGLVFTGDGGRGLGVLVPE